MIKQASSGDDDDDLAMPRPMRRLRRLSDPRCAEVAADLADETSEDDAGKDWGETSHLKLHSGIPSGPGSTF